MSEKFDFAKIKDQKKFETLPKKEQEHVVDEVVEFLKDKIGADDVVFCISAGNAFEVAEKLKQ